MAKYQIGEGVYELPDDITPDQLSGVVAHIGGGQQPQPTTQPQQAAQGSYGDSYFAQGTSGVNEGIANTLGMPVDLMNSAMGAAAKGVNAVAGTDLRTSNRPFLGSQMIKETMGRAIRPPTDSRPKQVLRRIGQEAGSAIIPVGAAASTAAAPMKVISAGLASALGGGVGAATAQQVAPNNPYAEIAGQLIGAGIPTGISAYRNMPKKVPAPSVDDLKGAAGKLYDQADSSGLRIPQAATRQAADEIRDIAFKEGLISPTGRISTAYPKVSDTLKTFEDYAQGDMSIRQVQAARRTLSNMAKSADLSEARIGSTMLDKFDDLVSSQSPELMQANSIYHQAKNGERIEMAIDLAASRAGQYSGSGFENALRTEFRQLERKIIKGQLKGVSPEETAAISKVAQGGPVENAFRYVGKLAPTGPVSLATSGGVPFMVGNAIGGPAVGAAASGASMGAGFIGRDVATRLAARNADLASEIARGGATAGAGPVVGDAQKRVIAAMLATQAAGHSEKR